MVVRIIFYISFYISSINAFSNTDRSELFDNLSIHKTTEEQYDELINLSSKYFNTPKEIEIQKSIINIANQNKDEKQLLKSYKIIVRNYYNRGIEDSIKYYIDIMRPIAVKNNDFQQFSFAYSLLCFRYITKNDFESTLNHLHTLRSFDESFSDIYIDIVYNEVMGRMYRKIGDNARSIDFFRNSLDLIPKDKENRANTGQHYTEIITQYLQLDDCTNALLYINKYDSIIIVDSLLNDYEIKTDRSRKLCNIFYLHTYIQKDEKENCQQYISNLYGSAPVNDWYVEMLMHNAFSKYYIYNKDYKNALLAINKALEIRPNNKSLHLRKSEILAALGRYESSNDILKNLYNEKREELDKSLSHDIDNLFLNEEMTSMKEHAAALEIKRQKTIYEISLIIGTIVFLIVVIMIYFHLRSQKAKEKLRMARAELLKDKRSLLKAKLLLENARNKTEESNRLKSSFLANMSHEIRTPLNSIVGFSELITSITIDGSKQKKFAQIIKYNSSILLNLINNILELSRLDSGAMVFTFSDVNISDELSELCSKLNNNRDKKIDVIHRRAECDINLKTDKYKFIQIISLLLDNAMRYTENGWVAITEYKTDASIIISIKDTGCGIPVNKKELIFERFEKLNEFTQGVGLGLPICRSLTEKTGGKIYLNEKYTAGAEFIIEYPISELATQHLA